MRVEVLRGDPTAEEVAALVAALAVAAEADRARSDQAPLPAWMRAARLEGVGRKPATSPADLS